MTMTQTNVTTQVFRVFIKASAQQVWDAITDPEWNGRYAYRARSEYDLRPGGEYRVPATDEMRSYGLTADNLIDGEVLEVDPPRRLVQTWHAHFTDETTAEAVTTLTWDLDETDGMTRLTVTHDLEGAPTSVPFVTGEDVAAGGGWPWILSDLKTLLETGRAIAG